MRDFCVHLTISLALVLAFGAGLSIAQDASNATDQAAVESAVDLNESSNITIAAPEVLGVIAPKAYQDVTKTAEVQSVFSRNPSENLNITDVDTAEKWLAITNRGIATTDLAGWSITSNGNATFVFPTYELAAKASVKVREGSGAGTKGELFTNSSAPLWIGDVVELIDASGVPVGQFQISAKPPQPVAVKDPLKGLIQF